MNAYRNLFALHATLKTARRNADAFQYNSHGSVLLLPFMGVTTAIVGLLSRPMLTDVFANFCLIAGALFILSSPIPVYLERRKRGALATAIQTAQTSYLNALHAVLDAKGYEGEYLSENDPSSSHYRCVAIKDGTPEVLCVEAKHDGMLISSRKTMLTLA